MATYNRSQLVGSAIESILNQSESNFEFIIINDGSTDDTVDVIAQYAKQDNRIRAYNINNQGLARARNRGTKLAHGKYIAFMDDDDISLPQRLEKQLLFLSSHPSLMACTCFYYYYTMESSRKTIIGEYKPSVTFVNPMPKELVVPVPMIFSPITFIVREAIIKCKGWRSVFTVAQDLDFTLRFQEKFKSGVVPEFLYSYYSPMNNFGKNNSTANILNTLHCHLAAYTVAWYRRYLGYDPLDREDGISEQLLSKLVAQIPNDVKKDIIDSAKYILVSIRYMENLTIDDVLACIRTIRLYNHNSYLINKVQRKAIKLFLKQRRFKDTILLLKKLH